MKKGLWRALSLGLVMSFILSCVGFAEEERINSDTILEAAIDGDHDEVVRQIFTDQSHIIDKTVDVTVTIDEESDPIEREYMKNMFGVQYESDRGWELQYDENLNPRPEFWEKTGEMFPQPIVRWGGTNANFYNVWDVIGPVSERKTSSTLKDIGLERYNPDTDWDTISNGNNDVRYGPVEFIKAHLANNPDVQFIFCLSLYMMSPEDTANFVRFLLDEKDESEWGAMRASYGLEDPINLYAIELGNELYFRTKPTPELEESATSWYVETCIKHIEAARAYYPDLNCIPHLNGNSERAGFYEWNEPVIEGLADYANEWAFHLYYSGYEWAHNGVWVTDCMQIFEDKFGPDHGHKLAFTEHAKWDTEWGIKRMGLITGLATAQFLNILSEKEYVSLAQCHCGTTAPGIKSKWAFITKMADDTLVFGSCAHVFGVYVDHIGDRILKTTTDSGEDPIADENSTARKFTVLATPKGSNELVLFLCNREPYVDLNVTFDWKNDYTLKKEVVLTAPNIGSLEYNLETSEGVFERTETDKNEPNFTSYHMPNKSLVCLVLESKQPIGKAAASDSGEITYEGESKFVDVKGHWAEAEINLMAEAGIVSGVGDGKFAPQDAISVAELSSMLQKSLGVTLKENTAQIYPNVKPGAWYYNAINSLALKGYYRKSADIQPEATATLSFAVTAIYRAAGDMAVSNQALYASQYAWFDDLTDYEKDAFTYAIDNQLLVKLFEASDTNLMRGITRAEAASLVYRAKTHLGY